MEITFFKKDRNALTAYLANLKVKYTSHFANNFFEEHPHRNNLHGLSQMLNEYGINNIGIRIDDKHRCVSTLDMPVLAHIESDFVTVFKISEKNVHCVWRGKVITPSISEFNKMWTGVVLIAEPDENSREPNFAENQIKEFWQIGRKWLLFAMIGVMFFTQVLKNVQFETVGIWLLFLVNVVGCILGILLLSSQLTNQSKYVDKVCSLFSKSDCNNVLESSAANIYGVLSWSEIGFGYFLSNVFVISFIPHLIPYVAIFNILALPFSFWSVWYQKMKVKEWCPICLLVQITLWLIFILNYQNDFVYVPEFQLNELIWVCSTYFFFVIITNMIMQEITERLFLQNTTYKMNSLKAEYGVFSTLLKKQSKYEVSKSTSGIMFGKPESENLVTIYTNPHCEPCGQMHARIEKLLDKRQNNICVQYIFSAFNEKLERSNKFLIWIYKNYEIAEVNKIYSEWFKYGKYDKEKFMQRFDAELNDEAVCKEFSLHQAWKKKTKLPITPTILINGYLMPEEHFKLEDLIIIEL